MDGRASSTARRARRASPGRVPVDRDWVAYAFVAAFGLCVGSFLNVVIHRLPLGLSLLRPRSRCPQCRAPIRWRDNLPLLSYVLLRGRCRGCRARISTRYPLVEALTAGLFLAAFALAGSAGVVRFVPIAALVAVAFIDLDHRIVPDSISIPGIVLGVVASAAFPALQAGAFLAGSASPPEAGAAVAASLAGAAGGAGGLWLVRFLGTLAFGREAMGLGDVKLLAGIGAWTGLEGVVIAFFAAVALGAGFGVGNLARLAIAFRARRRRRGRRGRRGALAAARRAGSEMAFAPYLVAGGLAALLARDEIWNWVIRRVFGPP